MRFCNSQVVVGGHIQSWTWTSDVNVVVWSDKLMGSVARCWNLVATLLVSLSAALGVIVWVLCRHWGSRLVIGVERASGSSSVALTRLLASDACSLGVDGRAVDASDVHDEGESIRARNERGNNDALHGVCVDVVRWVLR